MLGVITFAREARIKSELLLKKQIMQHWILELHIVSEQMLVIVSELLFSSQLSDNMDASTNVFDVVWLNG